MALNILPDNAAEITNEILSRFDNHDEDTTVFLDKPKEQKDANNHKNKKLSDEHVKAEEKDEESDEHQLDIGEIYDSGEEEDEEESGQDMTQIQQQMQAHQSSTLEQRDTQITSTGTTDDDSSGHKEGLTSAAVTAAGGDAAALCEVSVHFAALDVHDKVEAAEIVIGDDDDTKETISDGDERGGGGSGSGGSASGATRHHHSGGGKGKHSRRNKNDVGSRTMEQWLTRDNLIVHPVWIGNLPRGTTVNRLRLFVESQVGKVLVSIHISAKQQSNERTYAFLNLPTAEKQLLAVTLLDGKIFTEEKLIVRPKRPSKFPQSFFGSSPISEHFKHFRDCVVPAILANTTVNLNVTSVRKILDQNHINIDHLPNRVWCVQCTLVPQCHRTYCSFFHCHQEKELGRIISILAAQGCGGSGGAGGAGGMGGDALAVTDDDDPFSIAHKKNLAAANNPNTVRSRHTLLIQGLPRSITAKKIDETFEVFGEIDNVIVNPDHTCYVRMKRSQDARKIVHLFKYNHAGVIVDFAPLGAGTSTMMLQSKAYKNSKAAMKSSDISSGSGNGGGKSKNEKMMKPVFKAHPTAPLRQNYGERSMQPRQQQQQQNMYGGNAANRLSLYNAQSLNQISNYQNQNQNQNINYQQRYMQMQMQRQQQMSGMSPQQPQMNGMIPQQPHMNGMTPQQMQMQQQQMAYNHQMQQQQQQQQMTLQQQQQMRYAQQQQQYSNAMREAIMMRSNGVNGRGGGGGVSARDQLKLNKAESAPIPSSHTANAAAAAAAGYTDNQMEYARYYQQYYACNQSSPPQPQPPQQQQMSPGAMSQGRPASYGQPYSSYGTHSPQYVPNSQRAQQPPPPQPQQPYGYHSASNNFYAYSHQNALSPIAQTPNNHHGNNNGSPYAYQNGTGNGSSNNNTRMPFSAARKSLGLNRMALSENVIHRQVAANAPTTKPTTYDDSMISPKCNYFPQPRPPQQFVPSPPAFDEYEQAMQSHRSKNAQHMQWMQQQQQQPSQSQMPGKRKLIVAQQAPPQAPPPQQHSQQGMQPTYSHSYTNLNSTLDEIVASAAVPEPTLHFQLSAHDLPISPTSLSLLEQ